MFDTIYWLMWAALLLWVRHQAEASIIVLQFLGGILIWNGIKASIKAYWEG